MIYICVASVSLRCPCSHGSMAVWSAERKWCRRGKSFAFMWCHYKKFSEISILQFAYPMPTKYSFILDFEFLNNFRATFHCHFTNYLCMISLLFCELELHMAWNTGVVNRYIIPILVMNLSILDNFKWRCTYAVFKCTDVMTSVKCRYTF